MGPITLAAAQKLSSLLTTGNLYASALGRSAAALGQAVPSITPHQIVLTSVGPDMGDRDVELPYPRICLYSTGMRATQNEMFRALSGSINLVADVWASANLLTQSETWVHVYTDALASVLGQSVGDWGDGIFFPGPYDVQFQAPRSGGSGYVHMARVTIPLSVSVS